VRHDGADGDIENKGDVFVLHLFYVAEQEYITELRLKLLERGVDGGSVIKAEEDVFGGGAGGGSVEGGGRVFEKDSAGGGDAGTGGEEGVAENAEDPGLEVGAGLKESKARRALVKVSWMRSSASDGLRVSQRAWL
jgi:hypothetical protein